MFADKNGFLYRSSSTKNDSTHRPISNTIHRRNTDTFYRVFFFFILFWFSHLKKKKKHNATTGIHLSATDCIFANGHYKFVKILYRIREEQSFRQTIKINRKYISKRKSRIILHILLVIQHVSLEY